MATLVTPDIIAKEALRIFENNTIMGSRVYRAYESELRGTKVGDTVRIRKPNDFTVQDGPTMVKQTVEEATTSIVIDKHKHVAWEFSNTELTLDIEQYSERYIRPAVIQLVNNVDAALCGLYTAIPNTTGTAGTTPTNVKAFQGALTELKRLAVPMGDISLVLDPDAELELVDDLATYRHDGMTEGAIRNYSIGRIGGMDVFMDQNIKTHTAGTNSGDTAYKINGASQTGSTLTVDTGSGTFVVGDVITIGDDVYDVNPISKASTGRLKRFTVTAAMASGGTSLSIYPPIITSGAHQNVSAVPDDDDTITIVASHQANLCFERKSLALAMVPFERPPSAPFWATEAGNGFSIAVSRAWDQNTYKESIRLDILYGVKAIRPEHAIRLLG
jgi:hypothetical protein